jgi:hypothetical protein
MTRISVVLTIVVVATSITGAAETEGSPTSAGGTGSAVVQITTEPEIGEGTFRFAGVPAGELTLPGGQPTGLTATELAPGGHASTLDFMDPTIVAEGYTLTSIICDDQESTEPSTGDVPGRKATFRIEDGETVTCVFKLSKPPLNEGDASQPQGCVCPKQGSWKVNNHAGEMACTGSFSMTVPLKASRSSGTFEIQDDCETIVASGLSEDEETIVMKRVADCGYEGSVGGSHDGIPMVIKFTWVVHDSERITGDLHSTVSEQGMTCNMSRNYELGFGG